MIDVLRVVFCVARDVGCMQGMEDNDEVDVDGDGCAPGWWIGGNQYRCDLCRLAKLE